MINAAAQPSTNWIQGTQGIIHGMVGRTKQTRSTPELRSRKKVERHDMP
jgi:hypothetical protein